MAKARVGAGAQVFCLIIIIIIIITSVNSWYIY